MTTTKPVVDSLTTQGKGMPENDVPPQTIIGTSPRGKFASGGIVPDSIRKAVFGEPFLPGETIIPAKVDGGAEGIIPLSPEQIDDIAGTFYGDNISIVDRQFARKIEAAHGIGGPTTIRDVERQQLVNAEQRRQTVQAEAMVNLAVGVVAAKMSTHGVKFTRDATGKPDKFRVSITPQELLGFQRLYTVTQEIQSDGGFIISIAPKEV